MINYETDYQKQNFNSSDFPTSPGGGGRDIHDNYPNPQYTSAFSPSGHGGFGVDNAQQQQQQQQQQGFPNYPGAGRPVGGVKYDILDAIWSSVNQDLLIAKTFYFFFFSAFGSLFPLMGIFFKQLGMNPAQCGLLVGFRPFIEFFSAPFWGTIADRYQKGKQILLFSLACLVVFTLALCFISPPPASCIIYNNTHHILTEPDQGKDAGDIEKRSVDQVLDRELRPANTWHIEDVSSSWSFIDDAYNNVSSSLQSSFDRYKRKSKLPPNHAIGQSPGPVHMAVNYDPSRHSSYITPIFSKIVYRKEDVRSVFYVILLLVVIGEFFSAPAITLADSVTLTYLGENANNYGKQRMFGSLGWGLAMFFVGIALDHSTVFPYHPCGPHERERNYTICFAVFSVLMGCAFIAATQLRFDYDALDDNIPMKSMPDVQEPPPPPPPPSSFVDTGNNEPKPEKSTVFASKARQIPEWWRILRTFANLRYGSFLFVAWFMGLGVGFVFTFLFWHLQDLDGTPTLFGVASVINHISEIFAYFFSFRLIRQIGHVRVLCLGLFGNVARFLYVSWLHNPWWVLPFEFIQGVTHAAVWAACCSYITQATPLNLRPSAQGVLQGLHHGLGRGCGAVLGGLLSTYFGTGVTFRTYGFLCLLVLVAFIFINYYQPEHGFASAESVEPHQVLEESTHLAPHGVPSGPIPRALSSSRLEDMGNNGGGGGNYQTYGGTTDKQNGPYLDIPNYGGGGGWNQSERSETNNDSSMTTLAQALQAQKHSPLAVSPQHDGSDDIRNRFKVYDDVLNSLQRSDQDGHVRLLKAPPPQTVTRPMQPADSLHHAPYDW